MKISVNLINNFYWGLLLVTILMTYFLLKKSEVKIRFFNFGYVGLIVMCINVITMASWFFMFKSIRNIYLVNTPEDKYTAVVIDRISEVDSEGYLSYRPVIQFSVEGEDIVKELEFTESNLELGKTYRIHYDKEDDEVIVMGFQLIITIAGVTLFFIVFNFLFMGIILRIFGNSMQTYYHIVSVFAYYFFIPVLMIGLEALFIYGFFYGNKVPLWATTLLVTFIIILFLSIMGYIKMLFTEK